MKRMSFRWNSTDLENAKNRVFLTLKNYGYSTRSANLLSDQITQNLDNYLVAQEVAFRKQRERI